MKSAKFVFDQIAVAGVVAVSILVFVNQAIANEEKVIDDDHVLALACLEQMDINTTWEQCVFQIFKECTDHSIGTDDHVACLEDLKEEWNVSVTALQSKVLEDVTPAGGTELLEVFEGWVKFVSQKCEQQSLNKEAGPANSARLGCQITEMVGLSGEFAACLEGRSTWDYCKLKSEN